jgi:hypothetical protein
LGPQPKKRPSLGEPKWVALLRQAATQRLSLSVLRLSVRITRQRVGSTQQLVLAALVGAQALCAEMFVPRAGPRMDRREASGKRCEQEPDDDPEDSEGQKPDDDAADGHTSLCN